MRELKKTIKLIVKSGELAWGPSHLVFAAKKGRGRDRDGAVASATGSGEAGDKAPSPDRTARPPSPKGRGSKTRPSGDSKHFTGTFRRAAGGFGFVRPDGTLRAEGRDADIFVPANKTGDAASGDTVSVRLESKRGRMGKQEGQIIDVVERATNRFVGVYFEQAGMGMVQIDGKIYRQPDLRRRSRRERRATGRQGRHRDGPLPLARSRRRRRDSSKCSVRAARRASTRCRSSTNSTCPANSPRTCWTNRASRPSCSTNRSAAGGAISPDLTIVTIDPFDARDFDDAISLERMENGHWLLGVHIADVSHFVEPKTPLDREAYDRATSVYLPDRVIPMLPEIISNNLASLQPHKVRYALSAMMEFTEEGVRVATDVFKSAIKSRRRFTYEEVDEYLAEKKLVASTGTQQAVKKPSHRPNRRSRRRERESRQAHAEVDALLARMHELAMIFRARRFQRGALELSMPEMKIDLDADGRVTGAHLAENTESHQIIEEFMLSANMRWPRNWNRPA